MTEVAANVRRTVTVNRTDAKKLNIGECFLEFILSPIGGAAGYRIMTTDGQEFQPIAMEYLFS